METAEHSPEGKRYCKYTREMRLQLIRMVDEDRMSTAHAARLLGIKQTSACRIMRSFHNHHRIFEKKTDRLHRQSQQAQKLQQKDFPLSNKSTQQKNDAPQKQRPSEGAVRKEVRSGQSFEQECQQNADGRGINLSAEGMGVLLHPIFNFSADYFPIYYSGLTPFTYGYLM